MLHVEELETRLAPSTDLLSNVATPNISVVNSNTASPSVMPLTPPAGFSPQQISQAYGFNQITFSNGTVKGDGTGQTIAIVDAYNQPNIASDLATFDATYGLAAPPKLTVVNESGGSTLPTSNTLWGEEESLDVEWAHAIAPGASIVLVECNSGGLTDLVTGVNYARSQPGVSVVSMSWGLAEFQGESAYDTYFTTPSGHNGVTFVAGSGDSGSSGAPEFASVSSNVLAVGGTVLSADSNGNYQSETAWSSSGGGISADEKLPSYQPSTYYNGSTPGTATMRMVPDVAYNATNYAIYDTSGEGGWLTVGGTSAAAPQWAALVAIADQGRALNGEGTLDGGTQTLPAIYQLPSSDFHDITSGSNGGYSAGPGYDLVTGLGTPVANSVVAGLVSYGTTSPPPSPPPGPWVVTAASANPNPVTGTTTNLSVLGNDNSGASSLTYTWSVLTEPSGAKTPTFSINASNAAQNTTATFYQAGSYTFVATITDSSGLSVTSQVAITVNQTLTSIVVSPANVTLNDGSTQQFAATAKDQFGNALSTQPTFTWTVASGSGSVNSAGLYTAPSTGSGSATVQAAVGSANGTASVTYGSAPAAPSNLTATVAASNQVNLAWTNNGGNPTGLVVQRSTDDSTWTTLASLGGTAASYSDTSVSAGATYYYRVYADNSYGNSPYSNVVKVTVIVGPWVVTPASGTPNPVTSTTTNLSVLGNDNAGASSLSYTWSVLTEPSGAKTPTFSVNASNAAQNTTATFYQAGSYTFGATITDSSGLSVTSQVTITVNQTLTSVVVSPSTASVTDGTTKQFTATAKDQFGNALSTQPSFTWTLTSGSGSLSSAGLYTAPATGSGTATAQASANGVNGTASINFSSVPAAPSNLTATVAASNQVNLAWTNNASNATGIVVQRSTDDSTWTTLATLGGTAASYSDTSVSAGATYYYRVYADNSYGNSPYSNVVKVTVIVGPWVVTPASGTPNPVTSTTTNLSVLGNDNAGASSLTYTWSVLTEPSGAKTPTFSINASNVAQNSTATVYQAGSYTFVATITDSSGLSVTSQVAITVNQTLTSVVVSPGNAALNDGNSQQFTATGKDQFGNAMGTQPTFTWTLTSGSGSLNSAGLYTAPSTGSGTATAQAAVNALNATASITFNSVPVAPSNLTATAISTHQVNLAWTNNASNATGIVVQRSTDGSTWTTLATLGNTVASYADTSVSKGKTYYYRVFADNSVGNSPYSNVVQVTVSGSNGGGGGNKPPSSSTTQPNLVTTDPSAGLSLWQEILDMIMADIQLVESLLNSFSGSLG